MQGNKIATTVKTIIAFGFCFLPSVQANTVSKGPQLGWNSWNAFKLKINATILKETADQLVASGLRDAGYEYLVIDDGWQANERDANGRQQPNSTLFPDGIARIADYVHSKGLKLGIYSDAGIYTCGFQPGSWGYEELDAATYAEWGVDYLKYDNCGGFESGTHSPAERFSRMRNALLQSGRDIFYALCEWGYQFPWYWADHVAQSYRMSGDIKPLFLDGPGDCACKTAYCLNTGYAGCSVLTIIRKMREIAPFVQGGAAWADMDGLEIGHLTLAQERTQLSFWAALKSPLMISTDLSSISNETLTLLMNKRILAISQDALGTAAQYIPSLGEEHSHQVWSGPLHGGSAVVLILNERNSTQDIEVPFENVPNLREVEYEIEDAWSEDHVLLNSNSRRRFSVEAHDTKVLIFKPL
ncbi:glycoside hydrolase family 27 protein [Aaosphaeria arxii CBS 175.79]|uniref:Alpha-galactosidase n=1 Tax=Aaosphaeria arxii CBS 175.79 TaxID=1450172 RepID=A0A6A5YBF0_9PLEO|nr:glycoside hydrolase family 27 protein [Aaosphaeria arxii CBS 175.79]KAF2022031.1 glycoside hydrolase family 27 protein [Aaosphaeria arxii CBS 175.79]